MEPIIYGIIVGTIVGFAVAIIKGFTTKTTESTALDTVPDDSENKLTDYLTFKIAGLYYRTKQAHNRAKKLEEGDELYAKKEIGNEHDAFAVRIEDYDGLHLGYVPADYSYAFREHLDELVYINVDYVDIDDGIPVVEVSALFKVEFDPYE